MTSFSRVSRALVVGIAVLASSSVPAMGSTISPQSTDLATGFGPPRVSFNGLFFTPGSFSGLGMRPYDRSGALSPIKPMFSEITGYPVDMSLLASVKLTGPAGMKLIFPPDPSSTSTTFLASLPNGGVSPVTLAPGLTKWSDVTELAFTGTMDALNIAMSFLYVQAGSEYGTGSIKFTVTQNDNASYNVINDHFYQFIDWADFSKPTYVAPASRTWTKALADASQFTFKGVRGHLATITSDTENTFVRDRLGTARNVFLAGSDKDREGQWKWYAGPEEGQVFYEARCAATDSCNGEVAYNDRTPAINTYSAWATSAVKPDDPNENEPNDWGAGVANEEDYLLTNRFINDGRQTQDPRWNDFPNGAGNNSPIQGYVVEYSGVVADFSGVYVREVPFQVSPGRPQITARRISNSEVKISGSVYGASDGEIIELERKVGNGKYTVIASQQAKRDRTNYQKVVSFSVKMTNALNTQKTQYRLLMRKLPNLTAEIRSSSASINPIAQPPLATVLGKLQIAVGDHISNLKASLFSAKGLKPLSRFRITLRSEPVVLLSQRVGSDGAISARVYIPQDTEPGDHTVTITATGRNGEDIKSVATFTLDENGLVTAVADTDQAITELPATGNNMGHLPWLAAMFIIVGATLRIIRGRRLI